jgi:hypothetical protein
MIAITRLEPSDGRGELLISASVIKKIKNAVARLRPGDNYYQASGLRTFHFKIIYSGGTPP